MQGPDPFRRLAAVHMRHLHIHQDGVDGKRRRFLEGFHRLYPVFRRDYLHALHGEDLCGDLHVDQIILRQQHSPALQGKGFPRAFFRFLRQGCVFFLPFRLERDGQGKDGPLPQAAFHMDLPAHLRDQVFHDRHAKPRSGDLLGGEAGLPGIGFKKMRQEFLRHPDPRIPDDELIFCASRAFKLLHLQRDLIPRRGELERVGKEVV